MRNQSIGENPLSLNTNPVDTEDAVGEEKARQIELEMKKINRRASGDVQGRQSSLMGKTEESQMRTSQASQDSRCESQMKGVYENNPDRRVVFQSLELSKGQGKFRHDKLFMHELMDDERHLKY